MQYKDQTGNIFNIYVDEDDDETKYYETRKTKKKNNELTEVSKTKKNYIVNGRWKPVSEINVLNGVVVVLSFGVVSPTLESRGCHRVHWTLV